MLKLKENISLRVNVLVGFTITNVGITLKKPPEMNLTNIRSRMALGKGDWEGYLGIILRRYFL